MAPDYLKPSPKRILQGALFDGEGEYPLYHFIKLCINDCLATLYMLFCLRYLIKARSYHEKRPICRGMARTRITTSNRSWFMKQFRKQLNKELKTKKEKTVNRQSISQMKTRTIVFYVLRRHATILICVICALAFGIVVGSTL